MKYCISLAIAGFLLVTGLRFAEAQTKFPDGETKFPGGVTFSSEIDNMTDKKKCQVTTPMRGVQVYVVGPSAVGVWVHERHGPVEPVGSGRRPIFRIDKAPPVELIVSDRPNLMMVPSNKANQFVAALYSRKTLRVRWWQFPSREQHDADVEAGDFASAYDHAVKECGWAAAKAERATFSKVPDIVKADKGYISATFFPRFGEWTVTYMPEFSSCKIRASNATVMFSSTRGQEEKVLSLGEMIFNDSNGKEVGRHKHMDGKTPFAGMAVAPIKEILALTRTAGEYGSVKIGSRTLTLFGLVDAVEFAEKTCGLSIQ